MCPAGFQELDFWTPKSHLVTVVGAFYEKEGLNDNFWCKFGAQGEDFMSIGSTLTITD